MEIILHALIICKSLKIVYKSQWLSQSLALLWSLSSLQGAPWSFMSLFSGHTVTFTFESLLWFHIHWQEHSINFLIFWGLILGYLGFITIQSLCVHVHIPHFIGWGPGDGIKAHHHWVSSFSSIMQNTVFDPLLTPLVSSGNEALLP